MGHDKLGKTRTYITAVLALSFLAAVDLIVLVPDKSARGRETERDLETGSIANPHQHALEQFHSVPELVGVKRTDGQTAVHDEPNTSSVAGGNPRPGRPDAVELLDFPKPRTARLRAIATTASVYSHKYHRRKTASGERFDMHALTAAHRSLPFGTHVRVTNRSNGKSVVVRINDRGPFVKGRAIDLSVAAARSVGVRGLAQVSLAVVR
jgi:rare lipoprotein A